MDIASTVGGVARAWLGLMSNKIWYVMTELAPGCCNGGGLLAFAKLSMEVVLAVQMEDRTKALPVQGQLQWRYHLSKPHGILTISNEYGC